MGRADTFSSQSSLRRWRRIRRMARSRERAPLGLRRQGGEPYWLMPVISPHQHVQAIPCYSMQSPATACKASLGAFHRHKLPL